MSLREELNELLTSERLRVNGGAIIRGAVTEVVDKHEAELVAQIEALEPEADLSDERKLGYRLGLEDALGIFTGRIKRESHTKPEAREDRPAWEKLRKLAEGHDSWLPAYAIVEALDALGERLGK